MIDASFVRAYTFRSVDQLTSYVYMVPSIGPGCTSDEIRFLIVDRSKRLKEEVIHGSLNCRDNISHSATKVFEVKRGSFVYVEGRDWVCRNSHIDWSRTGLEPNPGETYTVEYAITNDPIAVCNAGKIETLRIACESVNFDVSIRSGAGVVIPSIEEVLRVTEIDQYYSSQSFSILFYNVTEENYLYGVITNTDPINVTGVVSIEFIISNM